MSNISIEELDVNAPGRLQLVEEHTFLYTLNSFFNTETMWWCAMTICIYIIHTFRKYSAFSANYSTVTIRVSSNAPLVKSSLFYINNSCDTGKTDTDTFVLSLCSCGCSSIIDYCVIHQSSNRVLRVL